MTALTRGTIFNIQRYSLHDGPGIRTIVFLKGCPLRCRWCCNPESQNPRPELAFNPKQCIGLRECGRCVAPCPHSAISARSAVECGSHAAAFNRHQQICAEETPIAIDRNACRACFRCAEACPARALTVWGREATVDEVLRAVEADGSFYARSGGGLTVSGGEPLAQAAFALELIEAAKSHHIHTSIETCGHGAWEDLAAICRRVDTVLYDIKCIDETRHREWTGRSNRLILANFKKMRAAFPALPVRVRTPVIPGFNDAPEDIEAIMDFIDAMPGVSYELLPCHRLGQGKYESLGRDDPLGEEKLAESLGVPPSGGIPDKTWASERNWAQLNEIARARSCHAA